MPVDLSELHAIVNIFVESPEMDKVVAALLKLDNAVKVYEVTGEFDVVTLVSASDIEELRDILRNKIMKTPGVKATVSYLILKSHPPSR